MSEPSYSAAVVIVGAGVAGSLAAHALAQSCLSVLVLDSGPRVTRGEIVENFRNSPATTRALTTPYPPKPWALAPFYDEAGNALDYLQVDGPDGYAYQTDYLRLVDGTTWHWAGCAWRHLPNDFRLKSKYGVGRDWPIGYDDLEPYYYCAEVEMGVCGPDPSRGGEDLGSPRQQPYPMDKMPLTYAGRALADAVAKHTGYRVVHEPEARNTRPYDGRPTCAGNNNCMPICPIGAMYSGMDSVLKAERACDGKLSGVSHRNGRVEQAGRRGSFLRSGQVQLSRDGQVVHHRGALHRESEAAARVEGRQEPERHRKQDRSGGPLHDGAHGHRSAVHGQGSRLDGHGPAAQRGHRQFARRSVAGRDGLGDHAYRRFEPDAVHHRRRPEKRPRR